MFKLVINSIVIASALTMNAATVDWSINLGSWNSNRSYYVINYDYNYDVMFGLNSGLYTSSDFANISEITGKLNSDGKAKFKMSTENYIMVIINMGDSYIWTNYMYSLVGRDLTSYSFSQDFSKFTLSTSSLDRGGLSGAVPEPSSGLLFMIGLMMLGLKRRK